VLLVGKSHRSHKVTQSHTEKVANNLKTRLFEFGSISETIRKQTGLNNLDYNLGIIWIIIWE
jgi:hypothetical protein